MSIIGRVSFILCVLFAHNALAWNADGHRIVAQIAYDHLSPTAKKKVDELTYPEGPQYRGRSRFLYISTWADRIRFQQDTRFDKWHYVSLPLVEPGATAEPVQQKNAVWAIEEAKRVLMSPFSSVEKQRTYLKLLVHIVGDIHQPLHSCSRYTWKFPHGDYGGNLYRILDGHKRKKSLHAFWDSGCGLFHAYDKRFPIHASKVYKVAKSIERTYSHFYFGGTQISAPTLSWANEGRHIAKVFAYTTPQYRQPDGLYTIKGRRIVEERLALAGYRLAHVLNSLYGTEQA